MKRMICPHGNTPKRSCKECIREKSKEQYHKNTSQYAELNKKWRAENKDYDKQRKKKWAKENPDKVSVISKRTQKKNIKKILEYLKVWTKENPEKVIEYRKKGYIKNKEKYLRITSIWRKKNKKNTEYSNNRRALRMGNGGKFSAKEWEFLKKKYDYKCLCCGRKEPEIKLTIDHVIPLIKGGLHSIENIQPLCLSCNSKKGARHETDYRPTRKVDKMRKIVVLSLLMFACGVSTIPQALDTRIETSEKVNGVKMVVVGSLYVREEPSENSPVIGELLDGDTVTCFEILVVGDSNWCRHEKGWSNARWLRAKLSAPKDVCISVNCTAPKETYRNKHDPRFQGGDAVYRNVETEEI